MKRGVMLVLLLLIGGAIVNVAVAWGIGMRSFVEGQRESVLPPDVQWWRAHAPAGFPDTPDFKYRHRSLGTTYEELAHSIDMGGGNRFLSDRSRRWRVGFPLRSMEGAVWRGENLQYRPRDRLRVHDPIFASMWQLPTRPIWTGFTANALIYGFVLWLLSGGCIRVRSRVRRRRGQCAKCAYPIGTSPVCTECGAVVQPSRPANDCP